METVQQFSKSVIDNVEKVIVGKREAIELAIVGLLSQGHMLIDDVPGLGKRCWRAAWRARWGVPSAAFSLRPICCPVMSPAYQCTTRLMVHSSFALAR